MKAEAFWKRLEKGEEGDCWTWGGFRNGQGYGRLNFEGQMQLAHRIAWTLTYGPIPDGVCVLHSCDNPPCCRPDHLFLGTRQGNKDDRIRKGRM